MMKRVTWFVGGVAAGAIGAGRAKRKVQSVAAELTPVRVAKRTTHRVRQRGRDVAEAVKEGRRAMRAKELELRARLDGRASTLADELQEESTVLVDGRPVEPGQVIVLRQVRGHQPAGGQAAGQPSASRTGQRNGSRSTTRPRRQA